MREQVLTARNCEALVTNYYFFNFYTGDKVLLLLLLLGDKQSMVLHIHASSSLLVAAKVGK